MTMTLTVASQAFQKTVSVHSEGLTSE